MSSNEPPPYPGPQGQPEQPPGYPPNYPPAQGGGYPPPPPGPGGYPPPPPPGPYGYLPTYSLGGALSWGWLKFRQNLGPIMLGILLVVVLSVVWNFLGAVVAGQSITEFAAGDGPYDARYFVGELITVIASVWIGAGWVRASLDVADGKRFDYLDALFRVPVVKLLLAALIVSVLVVLGLVALIIGAFVMMLLTYLTMYALLDEDLGPWAAVQRCITVTWRNFGEALLLALVTILLIFAGLLALVVGVLVAGPVTSLAATYAWRHWSGRTVAA